MAFPATRFRRLRRTEAIRRLVRETRLDPQIWSSPSSSSRASAAIAPMPGFPTAPPSTDRPPRRRARPHEAGCAGVLLFGLPGHKDEEGSRPGTTTASCSSAPARSGRPPELPIITDVCLCQYTDHGACGVLGASGEVDNDATLELLARIAVSHAEAGADFVAPSDMMDGRVGAIRAALDDAGLLETGLISYCAKYASAFYGPFREAAASAPRSGDRKGHQIDPANGREGSASRSPTSTRAPTC